MLPLAVAVLVRRADGRFLFVRRAPSRPAPGYWTPVTGRVETGESLVAAARREVLEETGLAVAVEPDELGRTPTEARGGFLLCWFLAAPEEDRPLLLDPAEVADARWLTVTEFFALEPTFETTRRFLVENVR